MPLTFAVPVPMRPTQIARREAYANDIDFIAQSQAND